jgi:uncharacterized hydrophobic protein (TIGR00271 family)
LNTLLLVHAEAALAALPWAARIAQRLKQPLVVVCVVQDPVARLEESPEAGEEEPALLAAARQAMVDLDASAKLYDCRGPGPRRAALNAIADLDTGLLVLNGTLDGAGARERGLLQQLARAAPVDVLFLDVGELRDRPGQVLFAQVRGGGVHGMRFALRALADRERPLLVIPDPDAVGRSRRALRKVRDGIGKTRAEALRELPVPESMDAVIAAEVGAGDLVLVDADEDARVTRRLGHLNRLRAGRPEQDFAIGVTRADHLAGPGTLPRLLERFHRHVPKLDREARRALSSRLERDGSLSVDFVVMLMLSALIAALGLIQNSTAVVIGGMLVAPLMTPMLACGLALIQGNSQQFRASCRAMAAGIGGAFLAASLVGLMSPWDDLSAEVVARGSPNLFDLGIAFASGMAAAYALARPGLAGTLVGVAVAVALVPPLAAAGIAAVKLEFPVATGAALLFVTNLLAIILGAALVFRLFGLDVSLGGSRAPRWVRLTVGGLAMALLPVSAYLVSNLQLQINDGVSRPYSKPLPASLRAAVLERVARSPGVTILAMSESAIEHGFGIEILLGVTGPADPALERELHALIRDTMGTRQPARVLFLQHAPAP